MMKLFARKRRKTINRRHDILAGRIAGRIVRVQSHIAERLNERTRHLTRRQKLILLVAFVLLFGAINCWLLITSLTH